MWSWKERERTRKRGRRRTQILRHNGGDGKNEDKDWEEECVGVNFRWEKKKCRRVCQLNTHTNKHMLTQHIEHHYPIALFATWHTKKNNKKTKQNTLCITTKEDILLWLRPKWWLWFWFCMLSCTHFLSLLLVKSVTFPCEVITRERDRKRCLWSFPLFKLITCLHQQTLLAMEFINRWWSFVLGKCVCKYVQEISCIRLCVHCAFSSQKTG